jgi:hypothetical protein
MSASYKSLAVKVGQKLLYNYKIYWVSYLDQDFIQLRRQDSCEFLTLEWEDLV